MSRTLIALAWCLAILSGCVEQPPVENLGGPPVQPAVYPHVLRWLDVQQDVSAMDTATVSERLATVNKSGDTDELFYYGVLNQQLHAYGAWTVARDAFQSLQENEALSKDLRQLAGIFRQYNQSRINGYVRQHELLDQTTELQENLSQAEIDKRQLEQKIQAITAVEAAISTRREE